MANIDNQCKDLEVRDYFSENGYEHSKNSLEDLYSLQAETQQMYFKKQGRKPFSEMNIGDVIDFLMVTNHAIIDELHEMVDAVGGIGWFVGWLGWLVGWLVGLVGWVGWLGWLGWLVGPLIIWIKFQYYWHEKDTKCKYSHTGYNDTPLILSLSSKISTSLVPYFFQIFN